MFLPFNFFLFLNTQFRSLCQTNIAIIGQDFPLIFLGFLIRCVLSLSRNVISSINFWFRVLNITSFAISSAIRFTKKQFLLKCFSWWSRSFLSFFTLVYWLSPSHFRSSIIFLCSVFFILLKSFKKFMDSVRSFNWLSFLIWWGFFLLR